jgi:FkbM family methyltransferase
MGRPQFRFEQERDTDQPGLWQRFRWKVSVRLLRERRYLSGPAWARRLPWGLWCVVGGVDATAVVGGMAARARRPLTFVQIGSNDGISNDPLNAVVKKDGWQGVLVEPMPYLFEQLVQNYAGVPGLEFENVAVGPAGADGGESAPVVMHVVDPLPGDPVWVTQLASLDESVVLDHRKQLPGLDERIRLVEVPSVTLPGLLTRHGISSVDLLHVDAEGLDLDIIGQIETGADWAPQAIIFEKKHLNHSKYRRVIGDFRRAGYRRVTLWPDELLYRPKWDRRRR